jgi:hypothetical protein
MTGAVNQQPITQRQQFVTRMQELHPQGLHVSHLPAGTARVPGIANAQGIVQGEEAWTAYFRHADRFDRNRDKDSIDPRTRGGQRADFQLQSAMRVPRGEAALTPRAAAAPGNRTTPAAGGAQRGVVCYYTMGQRTANGEVWGTVKDAQGRPVPGPDGRPQHHSDRVETLANYREQRGTVPEGLTPTTPIYTAAHKTLPPGTIVRVDRPGHAPIFARINDRGPYVHGRILDLSRAGARALGIANQPGDTRPQQGIARGVTVTPTGLRVDPTRADLLHPQERARRW